MLDMEIVHDQVPVPGALSTITRDRNSTTIENNMET